MSDNQNLFDSPLATMKRARARRIGAADFLAERAAEDLSDRLSLVLRPFPVAADIGSPTRHIAQLISAAGRRVIRIAPPGLAIEGEIEADPAILPLAAESIDLAVSVFGLDLVNDLPGALAQIRRALRPDGLFSACMLGGHTLFELRDVLQRAEAEITSGVSPRVHPFTDVRDIGGLLQRAGFALPVTDSETVIVRYADLFGLIRDLRAMGATNMLLARLKQPTRRSVFLRAAELYAERHSDADGRIRASFEMLFLSGWAAHASQQKPLRPGSAKARLADALKTIEGNLPR